MFNISSYFAIKTNMYAVILFYSILFYSYLLSYAGWNDQKTFSHVYTIPLMYSTHRPAKNYFHTLFHVHTMSVENKILGVCCLMT